MIPILYVRLPLVLLMISQLLQGTSTFLSLNNQFAVTHHPDPCRLRHDFLDDLESFFWVYAWIVHNYDGPGPQRPVEDLSIIDVLWRQPKCPIDVTSCKLIYMGRRACHPMRAPVSPYFSLPSYETLFHDVGRILYDFSARKEASEDMFPFMDEIYSKVLAAFDAAIAQLGGTPLDNAAQSDRPPHLVQRHPNNKRSADDDQSPGLTLNPGAKRCKVARPQPNGRNSRQGVRRSERIRGRDARAGGIIARGNHGD